MSSNAPLKQTGQWSPCVTLRILSSNGKRTLQQRWTRMVIVAGQATIEEKWEDVPTVTENLTE